MSIDSVTQAVALLSAISLASERFVTIVKTSIPWLADEQKTSAQETNLVADRPRRIAVQLIAWLGSWTVAGFLAENGFDILGNVAFVGTSTKVPAVIVGLLASGGSSLWSNFLGYTKAVKDIKIQQGASDTLNFHTQAKNAGVTAFGDGKVANLPDQKAFLGKIATIPEPPMPR